MFGDMNPRAFLARPPGLMRRATLTAGPGPTAGTISGIVRDSTGAPVAGRAVRAYRRDTGALLAATTTSDGMTLPYDPHWDNVVSLLHFDGSGSTFSDEVGSNWSVDAGPVISSAQSKFGGTSGSFSGAGRIYKNGSSLFSFGTGDFTIEMWFYRSSGSGVIFDDRIGAYGAGMAIYIPNESSDIVFFANNANRIVSSNYTTGIFRHIAMCRESSITRMFVNGILVGIYADVNNYTANSWVLGAAFNNTAQQMCFIDEFRATKGVARYTTDFTPPTEPFSTSYVPPIPLGEYTIDTGIYTGEVNVICLDDDAAPIENDLIVRAYPS